MRPIEHNLSRSIGPSHPQASADTMGELRPVTVTVLQRRLALASRIARSPVPPNRFEAAPALAGGYARVPLVAQRWHVPGGGPGGGGTSSAQARMMRAGSQPWSLRRPRDGDRNGTRSAPCADHGRVDRHRRPASSAARACSPAHRDGVRRFFRRFAGQRLEVALEATTGWRFVVEELHAVGAAAHLAEPAETAARRGNKKRAKTDRADARHLRELLMIGPAAGVLDPARAPARSARPGAAASHAGRSARRVAAAHPGGALSPRLPAAKTGC